MLLLLIGSRAGAQTRRPTEARLVLGGNYPDPTILKHGDIYYMTHSSFNYRPGLLIWQSKDMRHWKPLTYALHGFSGNVWAPELVEHKGKFYLYFPSAVNGKFENFVLTADKIEGPWSAAQSVGVGHIDPGHVVDGSGRRYLHLSGGHVVELSDDGLRAVDKSRKVHEGWPVPADWAIECFCLESPKFTRREGWYYLTTAQGGTFGPSTSHMITSFRSRSPLGPWESSPNNPVVRTWSREERWWSKGHGTLVEGPGGQWFTVLHGIPNGYRTLGRATLIEPIEWTRDGWYRIGDKWPAGWQAPFVADLPLSDEFDGSTLQLQWQFHAEYDPQRIRFENGSLVMKGTGSHAGDARPLAVIPRDEAYEIETELEVSDGARAGMMLFVSPDEYLGLSVDATGKVLREQKKFTSYKNTEEPTLKPGRIRFKMVNDQQDVRFYVRTPDTDWKLMQPSMEVSQNGILRPALFVHGTGSARFQYFHYRTLEPIAGR